MPNETGLQAFGTEHSRVLQSVQESDKTKVNELIDIRKNTWQVVVQRGFGLKALNWVDVKTCESLAVEISTILSHPDTIRKGEEISNRQGLTSREKLDLLNHEILIGSYLKAMETMGMPTTDSKFGEVQASLNSLMLSNMDIAVRLASGMSILAQRVPLIQQAQT